MNKLKLTLSALLSCTYLSSASAANIETNMAHLQAMDKITGRVSEIDVPVNGLANFGTFSILVRKCVTKSAEETPENTAFIDVVDNYQTANPVNIFKGWMFSSTPALNAVEHPIYDIWLLKCYNSSAENKNILSKEQLELRDTIPMVRQKPVEVISELSKPEADKDDADKEVEIVSDDEIIVVEEETIDIKEEAKEVSKEESIINIDIKEDATEDVAQEENKPQPTAEEEFASEGEEIIEEVIEELPENAQESEPIEIVITNE